MEVARADGHTAIADLLHAVEQGDTSVLLDETETLARQLASTALTAAPAPVASEAAPPFVPDVPESEAEAEVERRADDRASK